MQPTQRADFPGKAAATLLRHDAPYPPMDEDPCSREQATRGAIATDRAAIGMNWAEGQINRKE